MNKRKITSKEYNRFVNCLIIQKNLYRKYVAKILGIKHPFIYTRDGRRI